MSPKRKHQTISESLTVSFSSTLSQTACLSLFFVVEAPRRAVSYARRKPEVRQSRSYSATMIPIDLEVLTVCRLYPMFLEANAILHMLQMGLSHVCLRSPLL